MKEVRVKRARWQVVLVIVVGLAVISVAVWAKYLRAGATVEFRSRSGYTLIYPKNWIVDDSRETAPVDYIKEPSGRAFVAVQEMEDDRLKDQKKRGLVLSEVEGAFREDKDYSLSKLEWMEMEAGSDSESYMATGSFEKDGEGWIFREIAIFTENGWIIFLRGNAKAEFAKELGPVLDKVVFSFRPRD